MRNRTEGRAGTAGMCMLMIQLLPFLCSSVVTAKRVPSGVSTDLQRRIASTDPEEQLLIWVFFSDRETHGTVAAGESPGLSPRARRRLSLRAAPRVPAAAPIDPGMIDRIRRHVRRVRHASRYFNAVSVVADAGAVGEIAALECVAAVDEVAVAPMSDRPSARRRTGLSGIDPLESRYGESIYQLDQIQAIELLELGYNGSGAGRGDPVLVCVMDNGFNLEHEAFERISVVGRRDFVDGDTIVTNDEGGELERREHGAHVLGVIAGYREGILVGPAWGADYLLARTEVDSVESQFEEDNWIAGLEWADSAGAEVVTSSVGYTLWYGKADMDGDTPLCTRAADIAASRGIVVVNSAGNDGLFGDTTIVAPADGDSVIAVGSVDIFGSRSTFSSRGPTADGRYKPDLVALGEGTFSVLLEGPDRYGGHDGTSFAAPLVAGICALLLEIHPAWGPGDVRGAMIGTASRSGAPDNEYGYGLPRALLASGLAFSRLGGRAGAVYPNPVRELASVELYLPTLEAVTARVYDCRGVLVRTLFERSYIKMGGTVRWDVRNDEGRRVASGVYFIALFSESLRRDLKVVVVR